jgi:hypothetical protein
VRKAINGSKRDHRRARPSVLPGGWRGRSHVGPGARHRSSVRGTTKGAACLYRRCDAGHSEVPSYMLPYIRKVTLSFGPTAGGGARSRYFYPYARPPPICTNTGVCQQGRDANLNGKRVAWGLIDGSEAVSSTRGSRRLQPRVSFRPIIGRGRENQALSTIFAIAAND